MIGARGVSGEAFRAGRAGWCRRPILPTTGWHDGAAPWLEDFEQRVASMYGKEAAVWVPSGTMAQQITLCCAQKIRLGADRTPALPRVRRPFFAPIAEKTRHSSTAGSVSESALSTRYACSQRTVCMLISTSESRISW